MWWEQKGKFTFVCKYCGIVGTCDSTNRKTCLDCKNKNRKAYSDLNRWKWREIKRIKKAKKHKTNNSKRK
jgi:hypothetical protein